MRRGLGAAALAAAALASACGKKSDAPKPVAQREVVPVTHKLGTLSVDIALPTGLAGGPKDAASLHWNEAAGDTLDVDVKLGTPVAMQNELNETAALSLRVSRSDELPDGWMVTAGPADRAQTRSRRLIKISNTQAVTCTTTVTWGANTKKNTDWVESFCTSLAVKPQ